MTLDYPLLKDISEYTGIDKILNLSRSIGLEQKFLKLFPCRLRYKYLVKG